MKGGIARTAWAALALVGAVCLGVLALRRGEPVNALWIVVAAVSIYLVAYRYYSLFIAREVMGLDATRATPAVVYNDGLDYVPTNKHVLFGHHFAAIAGAVQDFMVLVISSRRNGRSLGDLVREARGQVPGSIALFGYGFVAALLPVWLLLRCGVPDCDNYVRHLREKRPDLAIPDYATFFRQRQDARQGRGEFRCG